MNSLVTWFHQWRKQPTTIAGVALAVAGAVYWKTQNGALAAVAAGMVGGALNDSTKDLLAKVEALEDGMRNTENSTAVTATTVAAMNTRMRAGFSIERRLPDGPEREISRTS
jgi:hypothetical protein